MTRAVLYLALLLVSSASKGEGALFSQDSQAKQNIISVDCGHDTKEIDFDDVDESGPVNPSLRLASINSLLYSERLTPINVHQQDILQFIRAPPNSFFKYS